MWGFDPICLGWPSDDTGGQVERAKKRGREKNCAGWIVDDDDGCSSQSLLAFFSYLTRSMLAQPYYDTSFRPGHL